MCAILGRMCRFDAVRSTELLPVGTEFVGSLVLAGYAGLTPSLVGWLPGFNKASLRMLYRASVHGWTAAAFHTKCDGTGVFAACRRGAI